MRLHFYALYIPQLLMIRNTGWNKSGHKINVKEITRTYILAYNSFNNHKFPKWPHFCFGKAKFFGKKNQQRATTHPIIFSPLQYEQILTMEL